jgi:hypothetical protein
MNVGESRRLEHRIKTLISKAGCLTDDELKAEIARYLCVLCSGFLEARCRELVDMYIAGRASDGVKAFVRSEMLQFRNPKAEKILQVIGSFDKNARAVIEDKVDGKLKDAVDSIISNRHGIAHGRNIGISLGRIKEYFEGAVAFMGAVQTKFK